MRTERNLGERWPIRWLLEGLRPQRFGYWRKRLKAAISSVGLDRSQFF